MAKILNPLLSFDASGSVSGLTFAKNHSGSYCRQRVKPAKKRTVPASDSRGSRMGFINYQWQNLSIADLSLWKTFNESHPFRSKTGHLINDSGRNWFFEFNMNQFYLPTHWTEVPPDSPVSNYFPNLTLSYTASGYSLSFDSPISDFGAILVYQRRNLRSEQQGNYYAKLSNTFVHGDTSPQLISGLCGVVTPGDIEPAMLCAYNQLIYIRCIDNYGRSTPLLRYNVIPT